MKRILLISFSICFYSLLSAQLIEENIKVTGDSINYLNQEDTIFISFGAYQEKIFMHYIAPKQTLYSLSKFYGLSLGELYYYNPDLDSDQLTNGQAIKIPIPNKSIIRFKTEGFEEKKHVPIFYRIKKGDTIFNLAKRVFKMPIDTIMVRNNLLDFTLSVGQELHLGWMGIEGIPEANRRFRGHPIWKKNDAMRRKYYQARAIKKEHIQKGGAFWQKQNQENTELYALHRTAPINSIVAVTNPMNKRTVYVKVIGKLPDSVYKDKIVVVVSSTAAKMLGAKDPNFYVHVRFTK